MAQHPVITDKPLTVTVVVPTFKRPDYLERCVRAIFTQTRLPEEIILVSRKDDCETNKKIGELTVELGSIIPIINPHVTISGFLPPIQKGIEAATMDIVAFLDDDCEAYTDWLERLLSNYKSKDIGGVGGRCISWWKGKLTYAPPAKRASYITWYGKLITNLYCDLTFDHPIDACTLMGGNCSYRRDVLKEVALDFYLDRDVASGWELDLGLSIKRLGYKLIFDPLAKVDHHTAPRERVGMRSGFGASEAYFNYRNHSYILCKHLNPIRKAAFLVYTIILGGRGDPGIISGVVSVIIKRSFKEIPIITATLKGKFDGFLASLRKGK